MSFLGNQLQRFNPFRGLEAFPAIAEAPMDSPTVTLEKVLISNAVAEVIKKYANFENLEGSIKAALVIDELRDRNRLTSSIELEVYQMFGIEYPMGPDRAFGNMEA